LALKYVSNLAPGPVRRDPDQRLRRIAFNVGGLVGKGELLLNGRRTDKPDVRRFVGRVLWSATGRRSQRVEGKGSVQINL
jgi:hypothetical protein